MGSDFYHNPPTNDTHRDEAKPSTPLEDHEFLGLKLRHWKQVAKEAALAGGMAYRTIKKTIESERTK